MLFCISGSIPPPRNSEPNPDGNEYTPRNKHYTQKFLHYRLKTLNPLTMTKLKSWCGYILCTVSITESRKRNIGGGGTACQQCSVPPSPPNKCQLVSTAPCRETHRYSLRHKELTYTTQSRKPLTWHARICVLRAVAKNTEEDTCAPIYRNPSI
jgi:hypothetical protein